MALFPTAPFQAHQPALLAAGSRASGDATGVCTGLDTGRAVGPKGGGAGRGAASPGGRHAVTDRLDRKGWNREVPVAAGLLGGGLGGAPASAPAPALSTGTVGALPRAVRASGR